MARPKGTFKPINWDEFDKLCAIHCTRDEIANWFNVSPDTIERAVKREKKMVFAAYHAQKADTGKISLRRRMWQAALGGDKTMMIWISKQHLGMRDKSDQVTHLSGELGVQQVLSPEQKALVAGDTDAIHKLSSALDAIEATITKERS